MAVDRADELAHQVLARIKEAGYVQLAEDQTLPENPHRKSVEEERISDGKWSKRISESNIVVCDDAQQDMLKAGWRKVK